MFSLHTLATVTILAGVGLSLAACTHHYTEKQDGKTIEVRQGETFDVQLDANPTTGYQWQLIDLDTSVLQQVDTAKYTPEKPGLIGGGGTETYTFKAVGQGTTTLRMHYVRPWEREQSPGRTYHLTVQVK